MLLEQPTPMSPPILPPDNIVETYQNLLVMDSWHGSDYPRLHSMLQSEVE